MNFMEWFKLKLTPAAIKEHQTSSPKTANLKREFDKHPSKGLTPANLSSLLIAAEEGDMAAQAELFMDMEEKDAHIAAELSKRKMSVKKLDWKLEPPRDATAQELTNTAILDALLRDDLDIGAIRADALDAIGHGYSCLELEWDINSQGLWYPKEIEHRPPSWFTCPPDDRNTLHLRTSGTYTGEPLTPFGWIPHVHKSRSGYLARTGLHRVLVWPYLFKNYSARDLAEFLEVYGLPVRIGKYQTTASTDEKSDLLKAVLSIGHNAAGIIPDSMQIELSQIAAVGNADAFMAMINWCESSISKAILGGTLTSTTAANGNRSLGEVHNKVRLEIRNDDAVQLDNSLSSYLIYPIAILNGLFADNRVPRFVSDTQEPDDLALYADALPKLAAAGAKIPVSFVNLKLKIPEPKNGEEILGAPAPVMPVVDKTPPVKAALAATLPNDIDVTPVTSMTNQLQKEAGPALKSLVDAIREKVDKADREGLSMEALRDDLLNSYGDLDNTDLIKVMALAYAAADLSGRYDVVRE